MDSVEDIFGKPEVSEEIEDKVEETPKKRRGRPKTIKIETPSTKVNESELQKAIKEAETEADRTRAAELAKTPEYLSEMASESFEDRLENPDEQKAHPLVEQMLKREKMLKNASPAIVIGGKDAKGNQLPDVLPWLGAVYKVRMIAAKSKSDRFCQWDDSKYIQGEWQELPPEYGIGVYVKCVYLDMTKRMQDGFLVKSNEELILYKTI